jgi:hypothetical protein
MPIKRVDDDVVISTGTSTTSNDSTEIRQKTSVRKDEVQFGIGADDNSIIKQERDLRVTQKAREFLSTFPNQTQAQQARSVLSIIDNLLESHVDSDFPEIDIFSGDDGTIGMQWEIGDTTLGIGIDPDIKESYWFLLSGEKNIDARARGGLNKMELMVTWLTWLLEKKQSMIKGE